MVKTDRQKCLTAFQKLRRLECRIDDIYAPCISCGHVKDYKEMDGGHYITRACRATEVEPDNVHGQCKKCNRYLSGNPALYRLMLIDKIGIEGVVRLEMMYAATKGSDVAYNLLSDEDKRNVFIKRTDSEYKELTKEFNKRIRDIQ